MILRNLSSVLLFFLRIPLLCLIFLSHLSFSSTLTIEDFSSELDLRDMKVSPNGRYLALVKNENGMRTVSILDLSKDDYPRVGYVGDNIVRPDSISWASDDRLLINVLVPYGTKHVIKKQNKKDFNINDYNMSFRTISISPQGKDPVTLMEDRSSVKNNKNLSKIGHFLPKDSGHVLMESSVNGKKALYKVNVYTGKSSLEAVGGSRTIYFLHKEDGVLLYRIDYLKVAKALDVFRYTQKNDWKKIERLYLNQDDERAIDFEDMVGVHKDDTLVYRKRNSKTGYYELQSRKLNSNISETLVSLLDKDVLGVIESSRNDRMLGYIYELDDVIQHQYFDKEYQQSYDAISTKVKETGGAGFSIYSSNVEANIAVIKTNGLNDPGSYHLYNVKENDLQLYGVARKKLTPDVLATPAIANYITRDKARIRSYVLFPPGYAAGERAPMVVLPHGGPQSRDYAYYDFFAQFIATRGYIVIKPNFRGSTGYGKEFEEAGYKQWGGIMQDDLEDAVNFMVRKGYADPKKVCIVGASYGGYAALMGIIKTPDIYQCAVSINGVTDLIGQVKYDKKVIDKSGFHADWVIERIFRSIGDPEKDNAMMKKNSPYLHVKEITKPVLIVAGTEDEVVPYSQSKKMISALKKENKKYTFVRVKGGSHNVFYYKDDFEYVLKEVESFLKDHLVN